MTPQQGHDTSLITRETVNDVAGSTRAHCGHGSVWSRRHEQYDTLTSVEVAAVVVFP